MGYLSGFIALGGFALILFSFVDSTVNLFIMRNSGLVVGIILILTGLIGFLSTFRDEEPKAE